jgi:hypothetical protein
MNYCVSIYIFSDILIRASEEKRPLGGTKDRWKDNIRIDFRYVGYESISWIYLVQDRFSWRALVNTVINS